MSGPLLRLLAPLVVAGALTAPAAGVADEPVKARLNGYQVVPSQNTAGTGTFRASVDRANNVLTYELAWQNLAGNILQSHIHFGRRGTNGDIVVFLCTNLNNTPPTATPAPLCVGQTEGSVTGVVRATDLVAVAFGGIAPAQQLLPFQDFDELANAIDAGAAYVVVHTSAQPPGELRGQIRGRGRNR